MWKQAICINVFPTLWMLVYFSFLYLFGDIREEIRWRTTVSGIEVWLTISPGWRVMRHKEKMINRDDKKSLLSFVSLYLIFFPNGSSVTRVLFLWPLTYTRPWLSWLLAKCVKYTVNSHNKRKEIRITKLTILLGFGIPPQFKNIENKCLYWWFLCFWGKSKPFFVCFIYSHLSKCEGFFSPDPIHSSSCFWVRPLPHKIKH